MAGNLVIIGAGGFGREAGHLVEVLNRDKADPDKWHLLGFIDEKIELKGQLMRGYPVLGGWEAVKGLSQDTYFICAIGDPAAKEKIIFQAQKQGCQFVSLVHPAINLAADVRIGRGSLINEGCILTTNIEIGEHVSINPGCGIGHDAVIEDCATLMWRVNISGNVRVGARSMIGTGATVLQGLTIGSRSKVGAGAVVTKDLPAGCTAVGIPARII